MKPREFRIGAIFGRASTLLLAGWFLVGAAYGGTTGVVVAWGTNGSGQCNVPSMPAEVRSMAAGAYHNLVLLSDGTVVAWGQNTYGKTNVPAGLTNVTGIAAGKSHSMALGADGHVVAWGGLWTTNVPSTLGEVVAIGSGVNHGVAVRRDGTVVNWGWPGATNVPGWLSNVVAVAGGMYHTIALRANGTIVSWGTPLYGLTNNPEGLSDVVAVAAGYEHNLVLKSDGTVVAWGNNSRGQTNVPPGLSNVIAIAVGGYHSLVLRSDGPVVAWGWNSDGQLDVPGDVSNVVAVAAGERHTLALLRDGSPHFTVEPLDRLASVGAPLRLHALAAGIQPLTYQWFHGGALLAGETNSTLAVSAAQATAGDYHCVASNALAVAASRTAWVQLTDCPSIIEQPGSQTGLSGENITFSVAAAGAEPLSYQWLRYGEPVGGGTSATLGLEHVRLDDAGAYSVLVSNPCGSVLSETAVLTVKQSMPLLCMTNVWKYDQSGLDLGTAWKEPEFNDAGWPQGPGALGRDTSEAVKALISTSLSLSNAARARIITYYFRTHFAFAEDPLRFYLTTTNVIDDGAIVYLNGQELYRLNMPFGAVGAKTLTLVPALEGVHVPVNFAATALVRGDNVLAVEVHQVTTNSSDVVFGLSLDAWVRDDGPATVILQPCGQLVEPGSNVVLSVVAAGDPPLAYRWQKNGVDLSDDERVSGTATPVLGIAQVDPGDVGDYSVLVQNAGGATQSQAAALWLPPPVAKWVVSAGSTGAEDVHDVAVDGWGNVYVAGSFTGVCNWGTMNTISDGAEDIYLAKYNRNGELQWVQTAGGAGTDYGAGLAVDTNGNCYVSGHFSASATFGPVKLTSNGSFDVFVAKYAPDGTMLWVRQGGGMNTDQCWSVAVDPTGGCYITGNFQGSAAFGWQSVFSAGSFDFYLARYDGEGNFQWVVQGGGTGQDYGAHVAADAEGAAHVAGWFTGSASFSGQLLQSVGAADALVLKYSSSGGLLWFKSSGGLGTDVGKSIAVETNGNSYVLGVLDANEQNQPTRLCILKYDADGALCWERQCFGTFYPSHCSIAADGSGCYLTGGFFDSATFGQSSLTGSGGRDIFIGSYDREGSLRWIEQAAGISNDFGAGVAVNQRGQVYLGGWFTGSARFGTNQMTSLGSQDLFVARLGYGFDPSSLRFEIARLANSEVRLRIRGLTEVESALLLTSSNLISWESLATNLAPSNPLELMLRNVPNDSTRFFRAVVPAE